jgi:hypothetical protein
VQAWTVRINKGKKQERLKGQTLEQMQYTKDKVKHLQLANTNGLIQKNIKMKSKKKVDQEKGVHTSCYYHMLFSWGFVVQLLKVDFFVVSISVFKSSQSVLFGRRAEVFSWWFTEYFAIRPSFFGPMTG